MTDIETVIEKLWEIVATEPPPHSPAWKGWHCKEQFAEILKGWQRVPEGHVVVPIEPTQEQRKHAESLVSIFTADDDHLRMVNEDLAIRCYRAMCRTMIAGVKQKSPQSS
jgi:hypothetical protein